MIWTVDGHETRLIRDDGFIVEKQDGDLWYAFRPGEAFADQRVIRDFARRDQRPKRWPTLDEAKAAVDRDYPPTEQAVVFYGKGQESGQKHTDPQRIVNLGPLRAAAEEAVRAFYDRSSAPARAVRVVKAVERLRELLQIDIPKSNGMTRRVKSYPSDL